MNQTMHASTTAPTYLTTVDSPIGTLTLTSDGAVLTGLSFHVLPRNLTSGWTRDDAPFREAIEQLDAYWSGSLRTFEIPFALTGTPFQERVWRALADIPYGETISYGELARRVDSPRAVRAVGRANGSNPLPLILPCHRVIGANGSLTGYGGGLERKEHLLRLEGALQNRAS
ncbi:MAG TPA: methylated-DNA--[protein]-cysteine S-methyltransferase [Actinomycetota bacterium]|nr:methylated-DNA--[protein]-cysteine S-methyltransferase [Actinomycetota bacterium]